MEHRYNRPKGVLCSEKKEQNTSGIIRMTEDGEIKWQIYYSIKLMEK